MINFKDQACVSPEPVPTVVELRFAIDATEAPLAYAQVSYSAPDVVEQLKVELAGPGLLVTLALPIAAARSQGLPPTAAGGGAQRACPGANWRPNTS